MNGRKFPKEKRELKKWNFGIFGYEALGHFQELFCRTVERIPTPLGSVA